MSTDEQINKLQFATDSQISVVVFLTTHGLYIYTMLTLIIHENNSYLR